jgi:hypothetical protein
LKDEFADRYLRIVKVADTEKIARRAKKVGEVSGSLTLETAPSLVALIRGVTGQTVEPVLAAFNEAEPAEESGASEQSENSVELQFLGEEAALALLATQRGPVADIVALGLITSDLCGLSKALRRQDLMLKAGAYLEARQIAVRAEGPLHSWDREPALDKAYTSVTGSPADFEHIRPLLDALQSDVAYAARVAATASDARFLRLEERVAMQGLYATRFSPAANDYYGNLGYTSTIFAAQDLAAATHLLPGLIGARRFLSMMLSAYGPSELDIAEDLDAAEPDSRLSKFLSTPPALVVAPILWSVSARHGDISSWRQTLADVLRIEWKPVRTLDAATQLYLEHILIRVGTSG